MGRDFIQAAIEKARVQRDNRRDDPVEAAPSVATPQQDAARPLDLSDPSRGGHPDLWGAIPRLKLDVKHLERHRIVAIGAGQEAIPFDVLRTNVLHQIQTNKWRRIAVTSPAASCGKTMVSLNLAFSLARRRDLRIMVVELDLRRPSLSAVLGIREKPQFSRVLQGLDPIGSHLLLHDGNLAFAASLKPVPHSAELLHSGDTGLMLDEIERSYAPDVMIFDMPPMLVSDDTMAFMDQVDCALLVAAAGSSTLEELSRCQAALEVRTNIMGIVMNKCRDLDRSESYGYGY